MKPIAAADSLLLVGESSEHPMHIGSPQLFRPPDDAGPEFVTDAYEAMLNSTDVQPTCRKHPAFFGAITNPGWSFGNDVELGCLQRILGRRETSLKELEVAFGV